MHTTIATPQTNNQPAINTPNKTQLLQAIKIACKKIAPVWQLENYVAVNPYLGMANEHFNAVANRLHMVAGAQSTLPVLFYLQALAQGTLQQKDLAFALNQQQQIEDKSVTDFLKNLAFIDGDGEHKTPIDIVSTTATQLTGNDWQRLYIDRVSAWASAYFDRYQARWQTCNNHLPIFTAWKQEALLDRTPGIMGLNGFRQWVKNLPNDAQEAALLAIEKLQIPADAVEIYLHRLLMSMVGWSSFVARLDWEAGQQQHEEEYLQSFLTVLLCWEAGLLHTCPNERLPAAWAEAKKRTVYRNQQHSTQDKLAYKLVLQNAYDRAIQNRLIAKINATIPTITTTDVAVKAVFCIDVRSEVFRRHLETVSPQVATIGFAGFFAFPISYVPLGHHTGISQCPVLLTASHTVHEFLPGNNQQQLAVAKRSLRQQLNVAWKQFRSGAISCFGFVSPVGLSYLPKLFTDTFGLTRPVPHPFKQGIAANNVGKTIVALEPSPINQSASGIKLQTRITMAENALKAMGITTDFPPVVLIVGHGSSTVNNPYAAGLDCGACGGHSGEANAKVAAAVLNDHEVRMALKERNINVPETCVFVAALHDTTTDEVMLCNVENIPPTHTNHLNQLTGWLADTGKLSRAERAKRMMDVYGPNTDNSIFARSKDWSQVRPEWGLAGCNAFIVAPREYTLGMDFSGRSFLHSYNWQQDEGFGVLELIMTAPMVVGSWINLQYFASTADNKVFGAGNKTLHNVVGGVGVLEGFSGDLKTGLPWQSVHDGTNYQHEPARLNVMIAAPITAMNEVLTKHPDVQQLCNNEWIYLLAINDNGKVTHRYTNNLTWENI